MTLSGVPEYMLWLRLSDVAVILTILRVGLASPGVVCAPIMIYMSDLLPGINTPKRLHPVHILSSWIDLLSFCYNDVLSFFGALRG